MGKLDVDDSEIKSITGISISEVSGDFSPEWLSCTFMDNVIKEINSLISSFNQVKSDANNYTDSNEVISNQPEPPVPSYGGGSGSGGHNSLASGAGSSGVVTMAGMNINNLAMKSVTTGTKITIVEVDDGSGWTKIRLEDGTEGYVQTQYLQIENDNTNGTITQTVNILPIKPGGVSNHGVSTNNDIVNSNENETETIVGTISTPKNSSQETATIMKNLVSDEGEETL